MQFFIIQPACLYSDRSSEGGVRDRNDFLSWTQNAYGHHNEARLSVLSFQNTNVTKELKCTVYQFFNLNIR